MASTYLTKSMSGNTASTKMTFSAWIKKSDNDTGFFRLFGTRDANHVYIFQNNIYFDVTNTSTFRLRFRQSQSNDLASGTTIAGSSSENLTNILFIRLGDT